MATVKGTFEVRGETGRVAYEFEGARLPDEQKDWPKYIAETIMKAMPTADNEELVQAKRKIDQLEGTIEELTAKLKAKAALKPKPTGK